MAYSKAFNFTPQAYYVSLICKALSHPARVEILNTIAKNRSASFELLEKEIPLKTSTISNHIRFLRDMRLVIARPENGQLIYRFNEDLKLAFEDIKKVLSLGKRSSSEAFDGENIWMERMRGVKSYTSY